jgi:hypothetical protein
MSRSLFSRTLLAFALTAVLLAPLWSFLGRLWAKEGCGLDPSGRCATSPVTTDVGCGLDPSGACKPASTPESLDVGCGLDPSGQCNGG